MTKPNVCIDPHKERGQSLYEHAASRYIGNKPWPEWMDLDQKERAKWARSEREGYAEQWGRR